MLELDTVRTMLVDGAKECEALWQENKDMQAQLVNDLEELQRFQSAITQLESTLNSNGQQLAADNRHRLDSAKQQMQQMQQKAAALYQTLTQKRQSLLIKLNDGVQQVALLQNDLIGNRLSEWKQRQKLAQIGMPFDDRDDQLHEMQAQ